MPDQKLKSEYTSNNSFMKSQVKVPKLFGDQYEDPLEKLKSPSSILNASPQENSVTSKIDKNQQDNITGLTGLTKPTALTGLTTPTGLTQNNQVVMSHPVSPIRDFTKTPNSITRQIMAKGLFKGKSKQIYDYLWSVSRGYINPSRTVRRTQNEIQAGSGIGSMNTIKQGIKYLEQIGLLKKNSAVGEALGNTYEIFTPEEVNLPQPDGAVSPVSPVSPVRQNLVKPVEPVSGLTNPTLNQTFANNYENSKTSFKDNTLNDDDMEREVFAKMTEKISAAAFRLTGKKPHINESEKWEDLADLLILELEKAAKHTDSISSIPAFLTETLRRQFFAFQKMKNSARKTSKKNPGTRPDLIGKSDEENFTLKALNSQEREEALIQLQEFADDEFLKDFEKWYVEDDWKWLMENLK